MIIVEYYFQKGHKDINKVLIKKFFNINTVKFGLVEGEYRVKHVLINHLKFKTRLVSMLALLYNLIYIKLYSSKDEEIIFMGFENNIFLMVSFLFRNSKLIVHNNIDLDEKYNYFRLRLIGKYCSFYVFENFIKEKLEKLKLKAEVIPHPRIKLSFKKEKSSACIILDLSSGNVLSEDLYERMSERFGSNNFQLITKKDQLTQYSNVSQVGYIENLSDIFKKADFILINNRYRYRVSGLYYLAVSNKIKILSTDSCRSMVSIGKNSESIVFI